MVMLLLGCSSPDRAALSRSANIFASDQSPWDYGLQVDSMVFQTRPSKVILTGMPASRLTPVYRVFYNERNPKGYIGTTRFHLNYSSLARSEGNQWHGHFMPGIAATHGNMMVNVSHHDVSTQARHNLFDAPVLIHTLYYPARSPDTLAFQPIQRNYYLVSVYDEDSNVDGFITASDLRRFYAFDPAGRNPKVLVPKTHAVLSSQYDPDHDLMYVFARWDENANGEQEPSEAIHIFWVDLKDPSRTGRIY
jgi:hypothetical protein